MNQAEDFIQSTLESLRRRADALQPWLGSPFDERLYNLVE